MSILLYTHPLCSDCQAFKAWIDEQDIEYTAIDISTDPQAKADLEAGVRRGGSARLLDHLRRQVDAENATAGAGHAGGDHAVNAGAAAEVHDVLARMDRAERKRVAGAGEGLDGRLGNPFQPLVAVADDCGQLPSGVEVESPVRGDGDRTVFLADLVAQDAP